VCARNPETTKDFGVCVFFSLFKNADHTTAVDKMLTTMIIIVVIGIAKRKTEIKQR
jgi:hypothetical protein